MGRRKVREKFACPGCGDPEALAPASLCWRCDVVLYQMAREQKRTRVSLYREITRKGGIEALSILNWKSDREEDDLRLAEQELDAMRREREEKRRQALRGKPKVLAPITFQALQPLPPKSDETMEEEALRLARLNPSRIIPIRTGRGLLERTVYFEPYVDARRRIGVRRLPG